MNIDDVVYALLLFFCIGLGHFYKQIKIIELKKWFGTVVGIFIILTVSNLHILHTIISFLVGTFIFFYIDARRCHIISFIVLFSYLLFFRASIYMGIPTPPGHTNLIQMILTLKLVGLTFEKNDAYNKQKAINDAGKESSLKKTELQPLTPAEQEVLNLKLIDIVHYCFCYVGVLTGPYFRYRTFRDYWHLPFSHHVDTYNATINKIKWIPLYAGIFLLTGYFWPVSYATDPEFYEKRSFLFRLWFVWPAFIIFRMRIYVGIILSECVCTMAGFGAYPKEVESKPGCGPSTDYLQYTNSPEKLNYDFETIHNIDAFTTDTCWTFRQAMKSWNMCTQYWLAVFVYKRFPNKKFRTVATLLVSAYWHGVYSGYYVCMMLSPFYLIIEDMYWKALNDKFHGVTKTLVNCIFWISKFFAFSYMGIAFQLMTIDKIYYYYTSVYHVGYLLWIAMYIFGSFLFKVNKKRVEHSKTHHSTVNEQETINDSKSKTD